MLEEVNETIASLKTTDSWIWQKNEWTTTTSFTNIAVPQAKYIADLKPLVMQGNAEQDSPTYQFYWVVCGEISDLKMDTPECPWSAGGLKPKFFFFGMITDAMGALQHLSQIKPSFATDLLDSLEFAVCSCNAPTQQTVSKHSCIHPTAWLNH